MLISGQLNLVDCAELAPSRLLYLNALKHKLNLLAVRMVWQEKVVKS